MDDLGTFKWKLEESMARLAELVRQREEELRQLHEDVARWKHEEEMQRQAEESWEADASKRRQEQEEARRREEETRTRRRFEQQAKKQPEAGERRRTLVEAWNDYEKRWRVLQSTPFLTFRTVPWPVLPYINTPESLHPQLISEFILSPEHSQAKSRKRRIHAALIRWHTDHFDAKVLHKVVEGDRKAVAEGVGRVVRCLNGMLATKGVA